MTKKNVDYGFLQKFKYKKPVRPQKQNKSRKLSPFIFNGAKRNKLVNNSYRI